MEQPVAVSVIHNPVARVLYVVRWVIIFGILLESRLEILGLVFSRPEILAATVAAGILMVAAGFIPAKLSGRFGPPATLLADLVFISVIVHYSDGLQSPFYPLYYIAVMEAATTVGAASALIIALAVSAFLVAAEVAAEPSGRLREAIAVGDALRTFPYLFLVAIIVGALRARIEQLAETTAGLRAEQAAVQLEMNVARRIHEAQLPVEIPEIPGVEMAVFYEAAREVGGDLYEFFPVTRTSLGIAVADVMGKGIPAALMIASTKSAVRLRYSRDLPAMMGAVNADLIPITTEELFVTMVYGMLSVESREFRYINAGHMPPIVVKGGTKEAVQYPFSDLPLAVTESADYHEQRIHLEPGDTLVLYTDGITDAIETDGDHIEAFRAFLAELDGSNPAAWKPRLARLVAESRHLDDVALVAIRIKQV